MCMRERREREGSGIAMITIFNLYHIVLTVFESFGLADMAFNLVITLTTFPSTTGTA